MRSCQLMFGLCALLMAFVLVTATTPPRPTTTRRSIITLGPRICPLPPVCARNSPRVCGRTPAGDCQRFANICDLILANRRKQPAGVRHTRDLDCKDVRGVGAANRRPCYQQCPRRPVVCKRSPPAQHICVRSRDKKQCKVLSNNCQLRNQNCHSRPRNNWRRTDKRRCGERQLGDKPEECRKLPHTGTRRTTTRRTTTARSA
ncbi:uncharacterized protein LOC110187016 [Drosophila serrata]|uniref:uncharacterized protein LOC110187016 n=1 Tax=Drosophila serrata TaxID=7274 RepID=UPI000A1D1C83|nr:uncharacterized protein LOC110187016 [Drosophila serrata]